MLGSFSLNWGFRGRKDRVHHTATRVDRETDNADKHPDISEKSTASCTRWGSKTRSDHGSVVTLPIGGPSSLYSWLRSKTQACSMTRLVPLALLTETCVMLRS
jgi:hypothetical protein